ncbi:hypothetical protein [Limnovirga soli]|uniref:Uncharacterized protein n=1 Tax=Limnovirga soli TaxID=2656915 RepID=A0A8J8FJA3_9BACT|nr:hypothetical protein [Limnovirga soli]NNV57359.1 hypothetical protein [Limnovirga soli]
MKQVLFTISFLVIVSCSIAQVKKSDFKGLLSAHCTKARLEYDLSIEVEDVDDMAVTSNFYMVTFPLLVDSTSNPIIKKNSAAIKKFMKNLVFFGDSKEGYFLSDHNKLPFIVLKKETGESVLILNALKSDDILNTLKLTAKERAAKEAEAWILPALNEIPDDLDKLGLKTIGINIVYASKDFSDDSYGATKAENLVVLAPIIQVKKYKNGDITENQLLKLSEAYMCSREVGNELKKIDLVIQ